MGSPKARVRLEDGSKVTAFLNASAKINVMTQKVMEDAGLAMRRDPKLELVSYTGHSRSYLGFCKDIEVAIGGLKTRYPIFVIKHRDYDLVLGQLFLNSVKFSKEYKPDSIFDIITHLQTQQLTVFRTLAPQDPVNRTENHIFFSVFKLDLGRIRSLRGVSVSALKLRFDIRQFSPQPIISLPQFWFS